MKLAAVIQLIDGHSQVPAEACRPRFTLDQRPCRPLAKPQAFFAFSDLAPGEHTLAIEEGGFFTREVVLRVPMAEPLAEGIVACTLEPSPLYPYPPGTTLLRGLVSEAGSGLALAGVAITSSYANRRGKALSRHTRTYGQGSYDGRYALALGGVLAPDTALELVFVKAGYADATRTLTIVPGAIQFVNIQMQHR